MKCQQHCILKSWASGVLAAHLMVFKWQGAHIIIHIYMYTRCCLMGPFSCNFSFPCQQIWKCGRHQRVFLYKYEQPVGGKFKWKHDRVGWRFSVQNLHICSPCGFSLNYFLQSTNTAMGGWAGSLVGVNASVNVFVYMRVWPAGDAQCLSCGRETAPCALYCHIHILRLARRRAVTHTAGAPGIVAVSSSVFICCCEFMLTFEAILLTLTGTTVRGCASMPQSPLLYEYTQIFFYLLKECK